MDNKEQNEEIKPAENQIAMFDDYENNINKEWKDMPEFNMLDKEPIKQLIVSFKNWDDYKLFRELVGQSLSKKTQSIWYPKAEIETYADKMYISNED